MPPVFRSVDGIFGRMALVRDAGIAKVTNLSVCVESRKNISMAIALSRSSMNYARFRSPIDATGTDKKVKTVGISIHERVYATVSK